MPHTHEQTGENHFRDMSGITNEELMHAVVQRAQASGQAVVLPGVTLSETAETQEFHNRLQRVQEIDPLIAENLQATILEGAGLRYRRSRTEIATFDSLDKLTNAKGSPILRSDNLNSLGLSKPQQVLFLRATIIATTARHAESLEIKGRTFSQNQLKLQKQALYTLRHIATNPVYVPTNSSKECMEKFTSCYVASYLARTIERELLTQGRLTHNITSIDKALSLPIPFGQLDSGMQPEIVSIFPPGSETTGIHPVTKFKAMHPSDFDGERIKKLQDLQVTMGGPLTVFRYYESIKPFKAPSTPKPRGKGTGAKIEHSDEEEGNYLVLEIEDTDAYGNKKIHVVTDNPEINNACYALRDEVLEEWERLIGVRLTWRDVFSHTRQIARQFGARAFHHNKGSDVGARVSAYLRQESASLVLETFGAIFDKEAGLFDANMQPTQKNRMPKMIIGLIHDSEILRNMWPMIHEHGYEATYRLLHATEISTKREKDKRANRRKTPRTSVEWMWDIFNKVTAAELDNQ